MGGKAAPCCKGGPVRRREEIAIESGSLKLLPCCGAMVVIGPTAVRLNDVVKKVLYVRYVC